MVMNEGMDCHANTREEELQRVDAFAAGVYHRYDEIRNGSTMATRKQILEILDANGHATISQIGDGLRLRTGKIVSSVTIRYHLKVLLAEGKISEPRSVPKSSRGRPQHVFESICPIDKGRGNSAEVLSHFLIALQNRPEVSAVLLEEISQTIAAHAVQCGDGTLGQRVTEVVSFLNERGYHASSEQVEGGFVLYTNTCPYHDVAERQSLMCNLDLRIVEAAIGQPIQRLLRLADGDNACAYFIANNNEENS